MDKIERPSALTCPECGGALREVEGAAVKQYRCHVGHRFGAEEVLAGQDGEVERALVVAMRVLNERIELCRRMAENARAGGRTLSIEHWNGLRAEAEEQFAVVRRVLDRQPVQRSADNAEDTAA